VVSKPTDEYIQSLLDRDGEIHVSSKLFGVAFYVCDTRETYTKRVGEGVVCFSTSEAALLVEQHPSEQLVRAAFVAKQDHPGIKIISFKDRKCQHLEGADAVSY